MTKEIKIDVPEGMEFDEANSSIIFKPIKKKLPMSVKEIENRKYYLDGTGKVCELNNQLGDINQVSTKERAEAILALGQLLELRDAWNGDSERHEYTTLINFRNSIYSSLLSFKTAELRNQFAEQFKDLIETAKELL